MIVEAIIGCLDSRGYLDASLDELRLILPVERPFDDSEIEHVLGRIQEVEPAGIGARNLRECLLLQLQRLDPDTPGLTTAIQVVESYLFYLAERGTKQLLETLQISRDALCAGRRPDTGARPGARSKPCPGAGDVRRSGCHRDRTTRAIDRPVKRRSLSVGTTWSVLFHATETGARCRFPRLPSKTSPRHPLGDSQS